MRKMVLCFTMAFFLAILCPGQSDDWKTYKNTRGNFAVLFPGEPQDTSNSNTVESHNLVVRYQGGTYLVIYSILAEAQPVDEATYGEFKRGVFSKLPKCEIVAEQAAAPAVESYVGHWYRLSCDMTPKKVAIEGNLYWGKHYAYAVLAVFPADDTTPPNAKKFIGSFAVIDSEK